MEDLLEKRKKLICELVEDEKYVPMKEKELAIFMQVKPEDRRELKRILEELLEEGKIEQTKRGRYVRAEKKLLRAVGLYQSSENFGFVVPDNKKLPDIFIPREKKKDAYDGAKVVAEYIESREEGKRQRRAQRSLLPLPQRATPAPTPCRGRPIMRVRMARGLLAGSHSRPGGRYMVCSIMYCPDITACVAWSEKHTHTLPAGKGMVTWVPDFW